MTRTVWHKIKTIIGLNDDAEAIRARQLIDEAMAQRAVFQLEFDNQGDQTGGNRAYLLPRLADQSLLHLESGKPMFVNPKSWEGGVYLFRFIMMQEQTGAQALYQFKSRVKSVFPKGDGISLHLPTDIERIERRENFRLRLKMRHLPGLIVWGLAFQKDTEYAKRIHSNMVLRLQPDMVETGSVIKNISSGGMRLAVRREVVDKHREFFAPNQNLKLKLIFDGAQFPFPVNVMLIARIRHISDGRGLPRVEMGLQFTRELVAAGDDRAWRKVGRDGVDVLGRMFSHLQVEYYKELKQILQTCRIRS